MGLADILDEPVEALEVPTRPKEFGSYMKGRSYEHVAPIVEAARPYVEAVAKKQSTSNMDREDLEQEGFLGVMEGLRAQHVTMNWQKFLERNVRNRIEAYCGNEIDIARNAVEIEEDHPTQLAENHTLEKMESPLYERDLTRLANWIYVRMTPAKREALRLHLDLEEVPGYNFERTRSVFLDEKGFSAVAGKNPKTAVRFAISKAVHYLQGFGYFRAEDFLDLDRRLNEEEEMFLAPRLGEQELSEPIRRIFPLAVESKSFIDYQNRSETRRKEENLKRLISAYDWRFGYRNDDELDLIKERIIQLETTLKVPKKQRRFYVAETPQEESAIEQPVVEEPVTVQPQESKPKSLGRKIAEFFGF